MKTDRIQYREATLTAAETGREITAIGVPYGKRTELSPGYFEEFAPGSVQDGGAILRFAHREPIGKITGSTDTEAGREITAQISRTARGDEIATLLADGVLTRMSIGFRPVEWEEIEISDGTLIRHQNVEAVEYSIVEFPAYAAAEITDVRSQLTDAPNEMEKKPMTTENTSVEITEIREELAATARQVSLLEASQAQAAAAPAVDTRSIGEILKAVADRDSAAIDQINAVYERAYTGGTSADDGSLRPAWVGDLTRLIDNANPLAKHFATGSLPAEGMSLEYSELAANTLAVTQQKKEGDPLATGKLSITTKTAPVETFGGSASLSFQEIQRTRANMLNLTMRGLAIAAGTQAAAAFHASLEAAITARAASAIEIAKAADSVTWADLLAMITDAAAAFQNEGLPLHGLIVNRETFLALGGLTDAGGRPLLNVTGQGSNAIGQISPQAFSGEIAGLKIIPDFDSGLDGMVGAFYNSEAIRTYSSGLAHLQAENILNLSRDISVYYYAAVAAEMPAGLLPLKIGAK